MSDWREKFAEVVKQAEDNLQLIAGHAMNHADATGDATLVWELLERITRSQELLKFYLGKMATDNSSPIKA